MQPKTKMSYAPPRLDPMLIDAVSTRATVIRNSAAEDRRSKNRLPPEPNPVLVDAPDLHDEDSYVVPPTDIIEGGIDMFDMRQYTAGSTSPPPIPTPVPLDMAEWREERRRRIASRTGKIRREFKQKLNARARRRKMYRIKKWMPVSQSLTLAVLGIAVFYFLIQGTLDYPIFAVGALLTLKGISTLVKTAKGKLRILEFIELTTITTFLFIGIVVSFLAPVAVSNSVRDFSTCSIAFYLLVLSKSKK